MSTPVGDPSQPTVYEMIRTVMRSQEEQRAATARLETTCSLLVTQDQRRADSDLNAMRFGDILKDVAETGARITWWSRAAMAGVGFPIIVGVIMWMGGVVLTMPNA